MTPVRFGDSRWKPLEALLQGELESPIRIREATRLPVATSASHHLEELRLHLADGRRIELLAKQVGPQGLSRTAISVKPASLLDPLRETLVYQGPLKTANLGTPHCYGVWEESASRAWLLLEKVQGVELFQHGEMGVWKSACVWLARLHARFRNQSAGFPIKLRLLRLDADYLEERMAAAWAIVSAFPGEPRRKAGFLEIRDRYRDWIELSLSVPPTLVHGDFYPANILVPADGDDLGVRPVDWEMAGWGPGLADLAALTAGGWTPDQRSEMSAAYRRECEALGLSPPGNFEAVLDAWRLHVAVQWIGWSAEWTPPPEQRRDWLSDALQIASARP